MALPNKGACWCAGVGRCIRQQVHMFTPRYPRLHPSSSTSSAPAPGRADLVPERLLTQLSVGHRPHTKILLPQAQSSASPAPGTCKSHLVGTGLAVMR